MLIIKIGGGAAINIEGIVADLANLREPFLIVHGANALRDRLATSLDIPRKTLTSVSGYSSVYSDASMLDLLMMAYAGLKNKRIVERCQQHGLNTIGLTGLDGAIIRGRRNRGIRIRENGKVRIVRDLSGKPREINLELLQWLLSSGYVPVLTVPIIDETGTAINSENDDLVVLLQQATGAQRIIQLIEAPGLLANPADPTSRIAHLTPSELAEWEERVTGRMKRKLRALKRLVEQGVQQILISDGRTEHPIQDALNGKGTIIQCMPFGN
ncbi:MAG: [LysW]-aminoadipate kinase [Calditrichaeota bacterium]|nr:[LysW]-aminoadipate kinase [Calditrichota bacterium]